MKESWGYKAVCLLGGDYNKPIMVGFVIAVLLFILSPVLANAQETGHNWRAWTSAPYGADMQMTAHLICNTETSRCAFATVEEEDTPRERSVVASGPLLDGESAGEACMTFDMANSDFYDATVLIGRRLCLRFTPDMLRVQVLAPDGVPSIWLTKDPALADTAYRLERDIVKPKTEWPKMAPDSQT